MDSNKVYDATADEQMQERNHTEVVRLDSKIEKYNYKILIKDKEALEGTLSRDDMELIHNLYASEGASLTQREVCRHLPGMILRDFKKILKAFSITKSSAPLAQHTIEENSSEKLVELTIQNKENHYLKRLEQDRGRVIENSLKDSLKKNGELKRTISDFETFLGTIKLDIKPVKNVYNPSYDADRTMVVYLSDMHIGAEVSGSSIYNNTFNAQVAKSRLAFIFSELYEAAHNMGITNMIVCNIGDSLDGYNSVTTRGGHILPQNMNNKEQFKNYLEMMVQFFKDVTECKQFGSIKYICVEGGNHDGDFGYMANKALEAYLNIMNPEIETTIFEQHIDYFTLGKHTFMLTHGKDARDMFKNMPLVLNDKWENQINEFIDSRDLKGHLHFVKGDLHQSATTYGKKFRYKAVSSFFGSSEWIHKNFGNTKAAIDYDIVSGDQVFESRLVLN